MRKGAAVAFLPFHLGFGWAAVSRLGDAGVSDRAACAVIVSEIE
jgi:hypothetical protein